jgi:hypothetical protein
MNNTLKDKDHRYKHMSTIIIEIGDTRKKNNFHFSIQ